MEILENIRLWIAYLKKKTWKSEREAQIIKIEIGKSAAVAAKAENELDIARFEARQVSGVVTKLQRRLQRSQDLRISGSDRWSNGSDWPPALESDSDDCWGPGPDPGWSCGRIKAPLG